MKISIPLLAASASVLLVSTFAVQADNIGLPSIPGVYNPPAPPLYAPNDARNQGSPNPYALSPSSRPGSPAAGAQFGVGGNQPDPEDDEDDFGLQDDEEE